MKLKVGTAGIPRSTKGTTLDGIRQIKKLELSAFEIEFVRGVYMSPEVAKKAKKVAKENNVALTVHAPYYVNLNSKNPEVVEKSVKRILKSADRADKMGASAVTYHTGYRHDVPDEELYKKMKLATSRLMKQAPKSVRIAPETTGKLSQFGTWEELLRLHKDIGCGVCFDFSHIWAREKGKIDFNKVLDKIKKDYKWPNQMHIHLSGIRYGQKGERNHQPFDDTKMPWKKVASLLAEKGFGGIIICENPNSEKGALKLKRYLKTLDQKNK